MSRNPLIVALDFDSASQARAVVEQLAGVVSFFKVGLELYTAAGMEFVRELVAEGKQVFLDLKLYDIGETVKRTVSLVSETGVALTTVHGSRAVMRAAAEGRAGSPLKILAVTVLTSFDQDDLADLGYPCSIQDLVELRVVKAMEAGLDGVVCSPLEVASVRSITGPRAVLVTPGVRPAGAAPGDQKRIATPVEALRSGADYVVVGRPISRAPDPRAAAAAILEEIRQAGLL
jgi:orotidine-5'-phosphate decarboxylase